MIYSHLLLKILRLFTFFEITLEFCLNILLQLSSQNSNQAQKYLELVGETCPFHLSLKFIY